MSFDGGFVTHNTFLSNDKFVAFADRRCHFFYVGEGQG